jgi:ribosomal protein L11 methyltransferase
MNWRQFVMDLEKLNPDRVEEVFARHGAHSITFADAGDHPVLEPAPGETPLWRDTRITALFSAEADLGLMHDDLLQSLGIESLPTHEITSLMDRQWEREWLKDFGPMQFGERLWICPGDSSAVEDAAVVVRLDPGLAFGTGTHATTALCLEWLDSQPLHNQTMLDYGCGSGVLAIAALLLGCTAATAMDIDPQAVTATHSNAVYNGVAKKLNVVSSDSAVSGTYDIVIANILAEPIIELVDRIAGRVKSGRLLALSGILSGQVNEVLDAYTPWVVFDEPVLREQGGQTWARLTGRRKEG